MYRVASLGVHCRYSVSLLGVHYKYNVASLGVHCMHNVGSQGVHCMHSVAWLYLVYAVCTMLPHCRYSVSLLVLTHLVYTMCTILHRFCVRYMYNVGCVQWTLIWLGVQYMYNESLLNLVYTVCTKNPYLAGCTLYVQWTLTWLGVHCMYNEPLLDLVYTVCTTNPYFLSLFPHCNIAPSFHIMLLYRHVTLHDTIAIHHCVPTSCHLLCQDPEVVKKKAEKSREARSESRRWQNVLSSMGEDCGDLLKFNQLKVCFFL